MCEIDKNVKDLQCCGCLYSCSAKGEPDRYEKISPINIACKNHTPATTRMPGGKILLGFPNGFNIIGPFEKIELNIFNTFEDMQKAWAFDFFNIASWKHLDAADRVFVRGYCPRINKPFQHVILENCLDKIDCLNVTAEDIENII